MAIPIDDNKPSSQDMPVEEQETAVDPAGTVNTHITAPKLLEFLVCPQTKTTLVLSKDRSELISYAANLAYPIADGIPMLTSEAARELREDERRRR